jgi:hypothetical protein
MRVTLPVTTNIDYYDQDGREIDFEKTNEDGLVPFEEAEAIQHILTCEVSIYLLRRANGICGSLVDNMVDIRRKYINDYERTYGKTYVEYNDFY